MASMTVLVRTPLLLPLSISLSISSPEVNTGGSVEESVLVSVVGVGLVLGESVLTDDAMVVVLVERADEGIDTTKKSKV